MPTNNLSTELTTLIEEQVIPCYDKFDKAHNRTHVHTVISQSLKLAQHYDVNIAMVYTIAAYHDLGLVKGREHHHTESARIVRSDDRLKEFFTPQEIGIIADAVEDHRASNSREPRTIYGKIIAEADRIIDSETIMRRTIQYGLNHYPALGKEEHIERARLHLNEKYSRNGYLKLWIPQSDNAQRLHKFQELMQDNELLSKALDRIFDEENSSQT
ncbi:MAG: HD domain-containing protein [Bacteroidaceae bacterium]|nr:HD domain-containing protein [Bacteroidaceae bacterium]